MNDDASPVHDPARRRLLGTLAAAAVTLFEFPGRRTFEWLLLLPLAMPAYVVAYAYTDMLQFSGPLQVGLRETFGWEGRVFPFTLALFLKTKLQLKQVV
mgnify:CR=1 FL=1